jgi:hypothetical protein
MIEEVDVCLDLLLSLFVIKAIRVIRANLDN